MATITILGSVAQDEVVRLVKPLQPGAHLNGVLVGSRLGGGGANTAVALAAAGHTVRLLAAVGRDAVGDALLAELEAAGVDTTGVLRVGRVVSGGWARWVVITDGAAGASAWSADAHWARSAEVVQPVDTTGAGDAFAAGLLHALVSGQSMTAALALAVRFGTEATLWNASGLPASAVQRLLS